MADPIDTIINPPISAMRFIEMVLYANRGDTSEQRSPRQISDVLCGHHDRFQRTTWDMTMMRFAVAELSGILNRTIIIYDPLSGKRWSSPHVRGRSPVFIYVGDTED